VASGLIIGVMARYGSEKIRGHGMPEAIESSLLGGSKIQPRVAILKPVSLAIAQLLSTRGHAQPTCYP
jgi:CIC family chloride channel protein